MVNALVPQFSVWKIKNDGELDRALDLQEQKAEIQQLS